MSTGVGLHPRTKNRGPVQEPFRLRPSVTLTFTAWCAWDRVECSQLLRTISRDELSVPHCLTTDPAEFESSELRS